MSRIRKHQNNSNRTTKLLPLLNSLEPRFSSRSQLRILESSAFAGNQVLESHSLTMPRQMHTKLDVI
jgi:hypothetical protein